MARVALRLGRSDSESLRLPTSTLFCVFNNHAHQTLSKYLAPHHLESYTPGQVHVSTYRYVPTCTDLYYDIVCTGTYYL